MGSTGKYDGRVGDITRVDGIDDATAGAATKMIERLMDVGIDGRGRFASAQKVAEVAIAEHPDVEGAIGATVRAHLLLGAVGGFVTGLGGFITMSVALPANVLEFYLVATRMVATIASIRGYDIRRPEVRSAILLALVGADSDDLLAKAGYAGSGRLANLAAQRLPGPALMALNKGVAFRLLTRVGRKSVTRFGRAVPLVGGVVGAGVDTFLLTRIADHARREFPPRARSGS